MTFFSKLNFDLWCNAIRDLVDHLSPSSGCDSHDRGCSETWRRVVFDGCVIGQIEERTVIDVDRGATDDDALECVIVIDHQVAFSIYDTFDYATIKVVLVGILIALVGRSGRVEVSAFSRFA